MGKKSAKTAEPTEPDHDPSWEKAVTSGVWSEAITVLPDANVWPTWGALRERVLNACTEISINKSPSLRDAFVNEVVKLSPPDLQIIKFQECPNLRKVVLSPLTHLPRLTEITLESCLKLAYVLIQSDTVTSLDLQGCANLTQALIQCKNLSRLNLKGCEGIQELIVWSNELTSIDLSDSFQVEKLKLHCPKLTQVESQPLKAIPPPEAPLHPPIAQILCEHYKNEKLQQINNLSILDIPSQGNSVWQKGFP